MGVFSSAMSLRPHLVGIAQRDAEQALVARLEHDDVLARGEHDTRERHHALLANHLPDDGERLLSDLAVGHDVVGVVEVELVDLVARHELVNVNDPPAFDGDGFELLRRELDVFILAHLITLDDVVRLHLLAALGVNLDVLDAMPGLLVDLMEAYLLALGGGRIERNGTGHERELEVTLPVSTRRHHRAPTDTASRSGLSGACPGRGAGPFPRPATQRPPACRRSAGFAAGF